MDKRLVFVLLIVTFGLGFHLNSLFFGRQSFEKLSPQEKHEKLMEQRDAAIREAKLRGDYRCCIEPPCTMCYMEANKWNNFTAGTCACDDLIALGEEACPQCKDGFCSSSSPEAECKIP